MEHLNKTQLILLAFLVSFVSSIATGIVTVTLMQQAPQSVTQSINRVVERTIEKVAPIKGPTLTETKVFKEEDFVVAAIEKNVRSVVTMRTGVDPATGSSGDEIGNGIVLTGDGIIATEASIASLPDTAAYYAQTSDGQILALERLLDKKSFSLFKVVAFKDKAAPKFTPVKLADSDSVRIGQGEISMGDQVATGIIFGMVYDSGGETGTSTPARKTVALIRGSSNPRDALGSAIFDLSGDMVGMVIVRGSIRVTLPSNIIGAALAEVQKPKP